ncbi:hypothetical protein RFI_30497, partial [Reticulomyxa filosa]
IWCSITVAKPQEVKDMKRLSEKIKSDYNEDFNRVFDIRRFTILCVIKNADKFNLVVSEDKDFFEKQSKTHHRFHNIKLYVPKHKVYVEMQACSSRLCKFFKMFALLGLFFRMFLCCSSITHIDNVAETSTKRITCTVIEIIFKEYNQQLNIDKYSYNKVLFHYVFQQFITNYQIIFSQIIFLYSNLWFVNLFFKLKYIEKKWALLLLCLNILQNETLISNYKVLYLLNKTNFISIFY